MAVQSNHIEVHHVRHSLRALLASTLVAGTILVGTAGIAAAASDSRNGYSFELYEDMCLDDGSVILCFAVHGRFTIVTQEDGDQIGTGAASTRSFVVENGVVSSAQIDRSVWQTKVVDGVFADELTITNSRLQTPGQQCVVHAVLKLADLAVVIDHASMSCT